MDQAESGPKMGFASLNGMTRSGSKGMISACAPRTGTPGELLLLF
jgi:hypothetical protein